MLLPSPYAYRLELLSANVFEGPARMIFCLEGFELPMEAGRAKQVW